MTYCEPHRRKSSTEMKMVTGCCLTDMAGCDDDWVQSGWPHDGILDYGSNCADKENNPQVLAVGHVVMWWRVPAACTHTTVGAPPGQVRPRMETQTGHGHAIKAKTYRNFASGPCANPSSWLKVRYMGAGALHRHHGGRRFGISSMLRVI
jgi:hypothetical protein